MKNVPLSKLQRWLHNARAIAEQAEALRKDISRECKGRENALLLTVYIGEARAVTAEAANELARLIALKIAEDAEQLDHNDAAEEHALRGSRL